jgi:hypothetical protein
MHINLYSTVLGDEGAGGFCTVNLSNSGTAWNGRATVQAFYNIITGSIIATWDNNAVGLTNAEAYAINYTCN